MALKLDGARRNVNKLMSDTCVIRRDQDHMNSAVLNPETLQLEADTDGSTVYTGGCFIAPAGYRARSDETGGMESSQKNYTISIAHSAPDVRVGDEVQITKAVDKTLIGARFVIREVTRTSALVWRQFTAELLETSRA